jgi:hypothetical protein
LRLPASSAAIDLGDKKQAYRRNGVAEYLVWQVFENKIDWYALTDGDYQLLPVGDGGVICSHRFPGLWLAVEAVLRGEMAEVLTVLQAGLQSSEHQAFVVSLERLAYWEHRGRGYIMTCDHAKALALAKAGAVGCRSRPRAALLRSRLLPDSRLPASG